MYLALRQSRVEPTTLPIRGTDIFGIQEDTPGTVQIVLPSMSPCLRYLDDSQRRRFQAGKIGQVLDRFHGLRWQ
jgi:hypothetical protein